MLYKMGRWPESEGARTASDQVATPSEVPRASMFLWTDAPRGDDPVMPLWSDCYCATDGPFAETKEVIGGRGATESPSFGLDDLPA